MEETAEMFNSFKERMKQQQVIQSNKSKPEDTRAKNNKGTTGNQMEMGNTREHGRN